MRSWFVDLECTAFHFIALYLFQLFHTQSKSICECVYVFFFVFLFFCRRNINTPNAKAKQNNNTFALKTIDIETRHTIRTKSKIYSSRSWNEMGKNETLNTFCLNAFLFFTCINCLSLWSNEYRRSSLVYVVALRMMSSTMHSTHTKTYTPFFIVIALLFSQFAYLHLYWWSFFLFFLCRFNWKSVVLVHAELFLMLPRTTQCQCATQIQILAKNANHFNEKLKLIKDWVNKKKRNLIESEKPLKHTPKLFSYAEAVDSLRPLQCKNNVIFFFSTERKWRRKTAQWRNANVMHAA